MLSGGASLLAAGKLRRKLLAIASRSDYGSITFRDWHTVGTEEYGYVAPDPLNPNFIYGGKVSRYDQPASTPA